MNTIDVGSLLWSGMRDAAETLIPQIPVLLHDQPILWVLVIVSAVGIVTPTKKARRRRRAF